mmetsp:Transcript_12589/g.41269  ORF Transcript_12589/g.41269 Transcript_12589/m.41269 type:complete len:281 (-) Transcript_12589:15-857(-)|eukprot:scaffold19191_cov134-Isochrysis_galbana.AAC.10
MPYFSAREEGDLPMVGVRPARRVPPPVLLLQVCHEHRQTLEVNLPHLRLERVLPGREVHEARVQLAELHRQCGQLVVVQVELFQLGELRHLSGQDAQLVAGQVQMIDVHEGEDEHRRGEKPARAQTQLRAGQAGLQPRHILDHSGRPSRRKLLLQVLLLNMLVANGVLQHQFGSPSDEPRRHTLVRKRRRQERCSTHRIPDLMHSVLEAEGLRSFGVEAWDQLRTPFDLEALQRFLGLPVWVHLQFLLHGHRVSRLVLAVHPPPARTPRHASRVGNGRTT